MDNHKVFDLMPEQFDRWRPRYCQAAFEGIRAAIDRAGGQITCNETVVLYLTDKP